MEAHAGELMQHQGDEDYLGLGLTLATTLFRVKAVSVAVVDAAKYGTSTSLEFRI